MMEKGKGRGFKGRAREEKLMQMSGLMRRREHVADDGSL